MPPAQRLWKPWAHPKVQHWELQCWGNLLWVFGVTPEVTPHPEVSPRTRIKPWAGVNHLQCPDLGPCGSVCQPGLGKAPPGCGDALSTLWRGVMSTQGGIERELSSFSDLWESFIIQTPMEMISLKSVALRQKSGTAWLLIALQIDIKYRAGATILKIKSFMRSSFLSIFGFDVRKIFYVSEKSPVLALGSRLEGRDYSMAVVVHHLLKGRPKL